MPKRIQRKRTKGWKMPEGAVAVDRSTRFGNPFIVNPRVRPGSRSGCAFICVPTIEDAVECYRIWLVDNQPELLASARAELRGKDLACWCPLDKPCHADVLLELANK
jgi:hypothetical protein